ncbi:MAG: gliding motility-associated C-terminal domain-containing protein [Bacteroidales bacterium]|nr:gliding motility-associated C-terminal domain-containing protein [Bacteroidales bacterium]
MGTPHRQNRCLRPSQALLHRLMAVGLYLCFSLPQIALGQTQCNSSTQGTDFWVTFLYNSPMSTLKLIAATNQSTAIHVYNHLNQWDTLVNAAAHSTIEIPVRHESAMSPTTNSASNTALHIVSDSPISLYASNFFDASYDIATILPTGALGTEYLTQTYNEPSFPEELGIAATADNTVITLHNYPSADTNTTVTLMRGQAVRFSGAPLSSTYLSSIRITSNDKSFALFQGNRGTTVGGCGAADHLYEQAMPVKLWGKHYLLVSTAERASGDLVIVTSLEDGCTISIDDTVIATLGSGDTLQYHLPANEAHMLTTSKPAYTCIYLKGIMCGNSNGDPSAVTVPPIEQSVNSITFQAINTQLSNIHYTNIVTRTGDLPYIMLDSVPIGDEFSSMDNGYSYLRKSVSPGRHTLQNSHGGFLAHFYGLGQAESYAYIAGMATHNLNYSLFLDGYNVRTTSRDFVYCLGDTAHLEVHFDADSVNIEWLVDNQWVATTDGQFPYRLDSSGWHTVSAVINICDTSAVTVYVHPKQIDTIAVTRCESVGFPFGDSIYRSSCNLFIPFIDTLGCLADTMYSLTVIPTVTSSEEDSICFNGTYPWHGHTFNTAGTYRDTLLSVVTGCDSLTLLTLAEIPKPPTGIAYEADCHESHYSLTALSADGLAFHWSSTPHDPLLDGHEQDTTVFAVPAGPTLYSLTLDYRCPYADTLTLHPVEWPHADFVVEPEWMSFDVPYIDAYDRSTNIVSRQWFIDNIIQGETGGHLHYNVDTDIDSILVSLAVKNSYCSDTLHRVVPFVHATVWAPNVFTPTLDINDIFRITLREASADELFIYDRHGVLIFHSQGPAPQWDGTHNGSPCPQGTYVWLLRYHHDHQSTRPLSLTGTVTLLR